jgi:dethiobiotin synthase
VLYVTGTDTGVGKTIAVATLAVTLGGSVAVYKPTQAGLEGGLGDIDVVRRLTGLTSVHEGVRLAYPMAPVAAAARERVKLPSLLQHAERIAHLEASHDHVLVEGAGGLLVALDEEGRTLADFDGPFVVVCRAALGTLNHTALTLEALAARNRETAGLIIGAWPVRPNEVEASNRIELEHRAPLLGALPEGAGALDAEVFKATASSWLRRAWREPPAPEAGTASSS